MRHEGRHDDHAEQCARPRNRRWTPNRSWRRPTTLGVNVRRSSEPGSEPNQVHGERNYEQNAAGVQRLVARVGRTTTTAVLTTPPAGDGAVRRLDGRKGLWVGAPVLVVVDTCARRECPSAAKAEKHTKQLCLARHVRHDGLSIAKGRVRRRARISETQQPEALHMRHGRARRRKGCAGRHATTESEKGWREACASRSGGALWCGEARGPAGCAFVRLSWHAQNRARSTWTALTVLHAGGSSTVHAKCKFGSKSAHRYRTNRRVLTILCLTGPPRSKCAVCSETS